jgi:hypothetical protein
LAEVLDERELDVVVKVFNILPEGNYRDEATGKVTGANIPHVTSSLDDLSSKLNMEEEQLGSILENARKKLFEHREKRVHPYKDDKILTDWNGLMIAALAKAGRAFDEPGYVDAARDAADFILNEMMTEDGRLLHRHREGESGINGHVDDYAFMIWGLLDLYEASFEVDYLKVALRLNEKFIEDFWDKESGGFFFTSKAGEELLVRKKEIYDGATPSGNSVAALNMLRLARMTANPQLEEMADKLFRAFSGTVSQLPSGFTQFMSALVFAAGPSMEVVIAGNLENEDARVMLKALRRTFTPNKVVIFNPDGGGGSEIADLAPFVKNQDSRSGKATAYVCRHYACELPTTEPKKMLELLGQKNP